MDVIAKRNWFFLASLVIILPGMISMATLGFKLGIDFSGGDRITLAYKHGATLSQIEKEMAKFNVAAVVQNATDQTGEKAIITTKPLPLSNSGLHPNDTDVRNDLEDKFGPAPGSTAAHPRPAVVNFDTVGPQVAAQLVVTAAILIGVAAVGIILYLYFRFNVPGLGRWKFAVTAVVALLHDIFVLTGVFSILGQVFNLAIGEIDILFVIALLTSAGFSTHNTIVIFDRIRENLRLGGAARLAKANFESVVNLSVVQSLARSLNTSLTVVFVLLALLLIAPTSIKGFALALLVGTVSSTYSSIFNSTPLLVAWRDWEQSRKR